jgi:hypothetical protein
MFKILTINNVEFQKVLIKLYLQQNNSKILTKSQLSQAFHVSQNTQNFKMAYTLINYIKVHFNKLEYSSNELQ